MSLRSLVGQSVSHSAMARRTAGHTDGRAGGRVSCQHDCLPPGTTARPRQARPEGPTAGGGWGGAGVPARLSAGLGGGAGRGGGARPAALGVLPACRLQSPLCSLAAGAPPSVATRPCGVVPGRPSLRPASTATCRVPDRAVSLRRRRADWAAECVCQCHTRPRKEDYCAKPSSGRSEATRVVRCVCVCECECRGARHATQQPVRRGVAWPP